MVLKLYNSLSRKKEDFISIKKGNVGLYTCGPTVYNFAHIGNLRTYIFEDILRRVLELNDFKVNHVMNITDVGHLTSDADIGEDKMLKGARREKKTVWEISESYTKAFKDDIKKLNILFPTIWCKATDHIKEQIDLIKQLEENGFTYISGGNVYFDTSKLEDYGKLTRLDLSAEKKSRVKEDKNKKNSHDFVLWFTKSKFQDQEMKWDSPFGKGYPGWHVECSAMASKYLGEQFDIHCGGIDHLQVHHTNEIAQSEAAFGKKPWVNFWLHGEFLVISGGKKMAKSGDNFLTIAVLENKGFDPLDYRYFCLGTHYRNPLTFSYDALLGAQVARKKLQEKVWTLKELGLSLSSKLSKKAQEYFDKFENFVNGDLNVPRGLALTWDILKNKELLDVDKLSLVLKFDEVLGLKLDQEKVKLNVPDDVIVLAKDRESARKAKDWTKADELRDKIKAKGYIISDGKDGFCLEKC
jgi:cysteinyl-tRNA synthetase